MIRIAHFKKTAMKKITCIFFAVAMSFMTQAQNKYFTRSGKVTFSASTPLETIEAENDKGTSVIDAATGQVEFSVLMKAFLFEKALMQEHFHENYVESDKFPKSTFKGTIANMKEIDLGQNGTYKAQIKGELTLHGITHPLETVAVLTVSHGKLVAVTEFQVALAEYGIEIPSIVREKISKVVAVKLDASYAVLSN